MRSWRGGVSSRRVAGTPHRKSSESDRFHRRERVRTRRVLELFHAKWRTKSFRARVACRGLRTADRRCRRLSRIRNGNLSRRKRCGLAIGCGESRDRRGAVGAIHHAAHARDGSVFERQFDSETHLRTRRNGSGLTERLQPVDLPTGGRTHLPFSGRTPVATPTTRSRGSHPVLQPVPSIP